MHISNLHGLDDAIKCIFTSIKNILFYTMFLSRLDMNVRYVVYQHFIRHKSQGPFFGPSSIFLVAWLGSSELTGSEHPWIMVTVCFLVWSYY